MVVPVDSQLRRFFYMAETGVFSMRPIGELISPPSEHFLMRLFHVEYRRRR